jgi:hypothetical protein
VRARAIKKIREMLGAVVVVTGIASGLGTHLLDRHYGV